MRKLWATWRLLIAMLGMALAAVPAQAQTIRHVWTNSPGPDGNYLSWPTAARNIQDAIDAASPGDLIWVTNGVYDTGGKSIATATQSLTNRIAIHKPVAVRAVSADPAVTIIKGQWNVPGGNPANIDDLFGDAAVRCAWLTNGASLIGFTLTNGATKKLEHTVESGKGGGAWLQTGALISNCVAVGNVAYYRGGGIYGGVVYNCTASANTARYTANSQLAGSGCANATVFNSVMAGNSIYMGWEIGGGVGECVVYDSLIVSNAAGRWGSGGGAAYSTLYNCRLIHNTRQGAYYCTLYDCIVSNNTTTADGNKQPGGGVGNCTVSNCIIANNDNINGGATTYGGGGYRSVFYNSIFLNNSSGGQGGATYDCTLYNCLVSGNRGGPYLSTAYNCLMTGNSGSGEGAASFSALYNCTVSGNYGTGRWCGSPWGSWLYIGAGGTLGGTNVNTIVYDNTGNLSNNYDRSVFIYSCTVPDPGGSNNITNNPLHIADGVGYGTSLVPGNYRLQRESQCMNKGVNLDFMTNPLVHATNQWLGLDLDGGPRIRHNTVDMGAYETRVPRGSAFSAE